MKLVLMSDTHGKRPLTVPDGDVLIHAGDLSMMGTLGQLQSSIRWLDSLPHKHKIVIAGNHDWLFQKAPSVARQLFDRTSITYLQDEQVEIEGLKFYGSPWQPEFCNWAFNLPRGGEGLRRKWDAIPDDMDVVITHGPAHGNVGGLLPWDQEDVGCELLAQRLEQIQPRLHVCGHVHCGYGLYPQGDVMHVNASAVDEQYLPVNDPVVYNLGAHDGQH